MSAIDIIRAAEFTAERAWGARSIANMNGTTVRLHWTDRPYKWHVNNGEEVFAVMDGEVDMHYRENGKKRIESIDKLKEVKKFALDKIKAMKDKEGV